MSDWYPTHLAIGGTIPSLLLPHLLLELAAENVTREYEHGFINRAVSELDFLEAAAKGECLKLGKDSAYYGTVSRLEEWLRAAGIDYTRATDGFNVNNDPKDMDSKDILVVCVGGQFSSYYVNLDGQLYLEGHETRAFKYMGMTDEAIRKMLDETPKLPGPVVLA